MKNKRPLISRLAHNITFLENITESEIGEAVWQDKYNCFAEIIPLSECQYMNIEGLNFGNLITEEYYLFKIRYIEGLTKKMRISSRGRLYTIKRLVNLSGRDRMLNIIAHEII
jgi:SPP1 family predicted phage head-tail adaptor